MAVGIYSAREIPAYNRGNDNSIVASTKMSESEMSKINVRENQCVFPRNKLSGPYSEI